MITVDFLDVEINAARSPVQIGCQMRLGRSEQHRPATIGRGMLGEFGEIPSADRLSLQSARDRVAQPVAEGRR